jgi:hypothetical protein
MIHKIIVSAIVAGLLGGYIAMLYAFIHILALIDHSYLMSSAM